MAEAYLDMKFSLKDVFTLGEYGLAIRVDDPSGPGGGYPAVCLIGERQDIIDCLMGWGYDEDDITFYLGEHD